MVLVKMLYHWCLATALLSFLAEQGEARLQIFPPYPKSVFALEGTDVQVTCIAFDPDDSGKKPARITFYRRNKYGIFHNLTGFEPRITLKSHSEMEGRKLITTIYIKNVTSKDDSDRMKYECWLFRNGSDIQVAAYGFSINIALRSSFPSLQVTDAIVRAESGDRISLSCNVTIPPGASLFHVQEMSWRKDDGILQRMLIGPSSLVRIFPAVLEAFIHNVEPEDSGAYTCWLHIRLGDTNYRVSRNVSVYVKPKSVLPQCPEETKDGVHWSSTVQGSTDAKPCPAPANGNAQRSCLQTDGDQHAVWGATNFVNCTTKQFVELEKEVRALVDGVQANRSAPEILDILANMTAPVQNSHSSHELYGGDLKLSVTILASLSEFNSGKGNGSLSDPESQAKFILSASNLLGENNAKSLLQLDKRGSDSATLLVSTLDEFGLSVAETLDSEGNNSYFVIEKSNIVMRLDKVGRNNRIKTQGLHFTRGNNKISLPPDVFRSDDVSRVASFIYLTLDNFIAFERPGGQKSVFADSTIVSSTVRPIPPNKLESPVRINLDKKERQLPPDTTPLRSCVFWRVGLPKTWRTDGCRLVPSASNDVITCECDHLTIFASLMDPHGTPIPRVLEFISLVGCSISTLAVLLTVSVTLVMWKYLKKPRTQTEVTLNVCVAIGATCILVIIEQWVRDHQTSCTVVAVLLHYFLLAMFFWMLCEGILLYIAVMKMTVRGVQNTPKYFYALGWGTPAIIVAVSLGATQTSGYGTAQMCWLSTDSEGLIWAVITPAAAVILVNTVIFVLVHRQRTSTRAFQNQDQVTRIRSSMRASAVILPLLGITWAFGVLSFNRDTLVFKYVFTVLNSLQGLMIFIFHCVLNAKIHEAIKTWRAVHNHDLGEQQLSTGTHGLKTSKVQDYHNMGWSIVLKNHE